MEIDKNDIKKIADNSLVLFVRGYLIPIVSLTIIFVAIFVIYIPYVQNVQTDYATLQDTKTHYDSLESRLSSMPQKTSHDQPILSKEISLVDVFMPDQPKPADAISQIQNIAQSDGLKFTNAEAQTTIPSSSKDLSSSGIATNGGLPGYMSFIVINSSLSGNYSNIIKFIGDIKNMKPTSSISSLSISGKLNNTGDNLNVSLKFFTYAIDPAIVQENIDVLNSPITVLYNEDYISKL